jgi:hypothetical protein
MSTVVLAVDVFLSMWDASHWTRGLDKIIRSQKSFLLCKHYYCVRANVRSLLRHYATDGGEVSLTRRPSFIDIDLIAAIVFMPGDSVYLRIYTQQVQHIHKRQHLLVHKTNNTE